jgi:hypothetical protein
VPPDILIVPPLRLALVIWRAAPLDVFCPARTLYPEVAPLRRIEAGEQYLAAEQGQGSGKEAIGRVGPGRGKLRSAGERSVRDPKIVGVRAVIAGKQHFAAEWKNQRVTEQTIEQAE